MLICSSLKKKGLRYSISYIANRHAEANDKYMSGYDSSKASKYIMYVDANNLYGYAMSQCLPVEQVSLDG